MEHSQEFQDPSSGGEWQRLGEIELPLVPDPGARLHAWLGDLLAPLGLAPGFFDKLASSVRQSVARVARSETIIGLESIHLIVFIQSGRRENGHAWGFFRIEKFGEAAIGPHPSAHVIEVYLYLER